MDEYGELPDLKMSALAVLFQTKWNSKKANRANDFLVKEALAVFASSLEEDDIGYFYDPQKPNDLCTNPGELVGKIANSHLPYGFNFSSGVKHFIKMLKSVDEDYNRTGVIVSDCLTSAEAEELVNAVSSLDAKIFIIGIGNCAQVEGIMHLDDAADLGDTLAEIRLTIG